MGNDNKSAGFGTTALAAVRETAVTAAAAQSRAVVESRYVMAERHPRNWDTVRDRLMTECRRYAFAESARYSLPRTAWDPETRTRKKVSITGLSIRFAEAAIRSMTNLLPEQPTIYDDEEKRIVRVMVTDLEANVTFTKDITIQKTVERKFLKDGQTPLATREGSDGKAVFTVTCTEDELAMKENALVAKAMRTLALRLLPGDIMDDCEKQIEETLNAKDKADPDAARKRILDSFSKLGISPASLAEFLGHPTDKFSDAEVKDLRELFASLRDGHTTWAEELAQAKDAREAFGGPADTPEARAAAQKRLAEARTTAAPEAYAAALKNCGIDDPAKAPLAQLEQALAILTRAAAPAPAATTAAPAAPAAAPAENPSDFAKRKAAGGAAPQGGAT